MKAIAFIPARASSRRIPNKNIVKLAGHPLIAYTIKAAIDSHVFESIFFITDSEEYGNIAKLYGIKEIYPQNATDTRSEYDAYIKWLLDTLKEEKRKFDCFAILRPTSPFRTANTIKRAMAEFLMNQPVNSLRAVESVKQHPGKMYQILNYGINIFPVLIPIWDRADCKNELPMRDQQIQALPKLWVQNGSLEIAWADVPYKYKSFSGEIIYPFRTQGWEGFDINRPEDLIVANWLIETKQAELPRIEGDKKWGLLEKSAMSLS